MSFALGQRSRERLQGVHPDLVKVVERAIELTSVDFTVLEGLRTVERQGELVAKGASQTMESRHLTGHAVDLGALIGGEVRSTGTNAAWGTGEWLVVEADESDRSFLKLSPEVAVVTNVELDHHTTFATLGELQDAFERFTDAARVVIENVEPPATELLPMGSRFSALGAEFELSVPGRHNAQNALAAALAAACVALAGVTHASTVSSPLPCTASITFVAADPDDTIVGRSTAKPPPSSQRTAPASATVKSSGSPTPDTSRTVVPAPSPNPYNTTNTSLTRPRSAPAWWVAGGTWAVPRGPDTMLMRPWVMLSGRSRRVELPTRAVPGSRCWSGAVRCCSSAPRRRSRRVPTADATIRASVATRDTMETGTGSAGIPTTASVPPRRRKSSIRALSGSRGGT